MRSLAALVASVLMLVGCTPDTASAPDAPTSAPSPDTPAVTTPSESTSTTDAPVVPRAPEEADCYRFPYEELAQTTTDRAPVSCAKRHNAVTIHVGRLGRVSDGGAVDSGQLQQRVADECQRRLARHLGGSPSTRKLSRFHSVWFLPTAADAEMGADWYRCDVVAFSSEGRLAALPRPQRLEDVLDRPRALGTYGLCGTAEPGSPRFARVICSRRHSWRAVSTIRINGGQEYPGERAVRSAGEDRCRDLVREMSSSPLKFRYGWEWPTRQQWRHGQRHGYCWAPERSRR